MKQIDKIGLVLRKLYELRYDQCSHTLTSIMKELGIYENDVDMRHLANRLEADGLAEIIRTSGGVDAEISTYGIDYFEEHLSGEMNQPGKTDRIVRWLYERRHDKVEIRLNALLHQLNIYESEREAESIAKSLIEEKLAEGLLFEEGNSLIMGIGPNGIKHCEGALSKTQASSFSQTNNFNGDFNAGNALFGSNNSDIRQFNTASTKEAEELISAIRKELVNSAALDDEEKEELVSCVDDIEDRIKSKKPVKKYQ
ncbi:hypothetical protein ACXYMU_19050 [Pontibacter sp. CAU 1760]